MENLIELLLPPSYYVMFILISIAIFGWNRNKYFIGYVVFVIFFSLLIMRNELIMIWRIYGSN